MPSFEPLPGGARARLEAWDGQHCASIQEIAKRRGSVKKLAKRVWRETDADNVPGLAAQTSYYFVLALFPFLIFLAAVVGSLPFTGFWDEILNWITFNLPGSSQQLIFDTINSLTRNRGSFFSIGLLGTAWAASAGLMNLMWSLNAVYEVKETRSFWKRLGFAFLMLFALTFLFLTTFGLLSAGDWLGVWLAGRAALSSPLIIMWYLGRWVLSAVLLTVAIVVLDYALPNVKRPWRCLVPGGLFVIGAWIPATLGLNLYIRHFASYNRTYGALGAFVVLMVWTYITSLIALIGAEVNCELYKMRAEAKSAAAKQLEVY